MRARPHVVLPVATPRVIDRLARVMHTASVNVALGLLVVGAVACGRGEPASRSAIPAERPATTPTPTPQVTQLALTENVPVQLGNGVSLTLVTGIEAHVTDRDHNSRNDFLCQLTAKQGSETRAVTLHRLTPDPGAPVEVFGVRLSLVMVDPYQHPTTATIDVLP